MSETKHTPGPWRTGRKDAQSYDGFTGQPFSSVYADDERSGIHLGQQLPLLIARVDGEYIDREEEKANANLIAAAPDLLDALISIEEYWNREPNMGAMENACNYAIDTARNAIAKARGES